MPASAALAALVPALGPRPALLPDWLDAEHLISSFGTYALIGIVLVVFIETGLLFPLLPGDSLLFTAGALVAQQALDFPLWLLCVLLFAAAFLGDQVAYLIGNKVGPRLFRRPDSRIFKQQYIDNTYAYFDKYGGRTVILARFVPIVRTYAPVAAGVGKMRYRTFVSYNLVGALVWGVGVTVLGYLLGTITFVRENIEALAILIVLVSVIPVAIELWRGRRAAQRGDLTAEGRDSRYDEAAERAAVERKAFDR
ncbi:VTT domain-containing protein [Cellulomonas triticagri]|uniref:VTT domain-containing protein n=1 Tax=Cellulomonas triticagri TaxID=2483352 RepID=A0A3M2JIY5_9CELL|nr:VTT domain-containing protein [Cellulomonas triticagri]RMI14017.1 hypothetical protein EBM89_02050 [Cellulomonas triticagri]